MDIDKIISIEKERHDSNMSFLKNQKKIFKLDKIKRSKENAVFMYKRLFKEMDIDKLIGIENERHNSNMSFLERQKKIFELADLKIEKERAVFKYKRLFKVNNKLFQELLFKAKNNITSPRDYLYSNMIIEAKRQLDSENEII